MDILDLMVSVKIMAQWVTLGVQKVQCGDSDGAPDELWVELGEGVLVIRLGCLLALSTSDGLDGTKCSVEPGLLGSLHLIQSQTQMVLQVLV